MGTKSILITQCLQNDFVEPIQKYDPIPNLLHVGYAEAHRIMGENPSEGAVIAFMEWAMLEEKSKNLEIIHIRDWHDPNNPEEADHLNQFSPHCLQNTKGAEFVYQSLLGQSLEKHNIVDASGLNDFHKTNLETIIREITSIDGSARVGLIGVWTEAKISFLAYELVTRYPNFQIGICSALTASSTRHMHYVALDQMRNLLGIEIFTSIGSFSEFLTGKSISILPGSKRNSRTKVNFIYKDDFKPTEIDQDILYYLYRDCQMVEFHCLDGGFSGNVVLRAKSIDAFGHKQVPTVIKIGARDPIAKERSSFERIEEVLGNTAPRIVDFAEIQERGGIKYRYAAMIEGRMEVFQDRYESGSDLAEIFALLDTVFIKQLGRLYDASEPEKLNLLEYYDFSSKYAKSVRKRVEAILGREIGMEESISIIGGNTGDKGISIDQEKSGNEGAGSIGSAHSQEVYNVCLFYERDLQELKEIGSIPHYVSYIHGDLNGKNIILDSQNNVWLIDFFHTHRGHILKDLLKLENDLLYIFMKIDDKDWDEACLLIDTILGMEDLGVPLSESLVNNFTSEKIQRTYRTVCKLRSFYPKLIQLDRDPYQMYVGFLRYAMHTLSFDECSDIQKRLALYAGCKLAKLIRDSLLLSKRLRIDFIPIPNRKGKIGLTILPGRKDRNRNLSDDLNVLKEEGIKKVYSLITEDEYREYGVPNLKWGYEEAGLSFLSFPILDQGIPAREDLPKIIDDIDQELQSGNNVLVHCVGGLGRSGTIAAAYLIAKSGIGAEDAIRTVRQHRSERAVESKEQINFLLNS
ncbi:isochorismatase family protein [Leptospira sp. GIMC2001]|uniref:isochorismatase family protein n=1 Tax=Leptospira sp. GIMC2001 TaxID=1513297 RepID=UPI002349B411|nr:isochorismatase family protein [Leptospira sp. GIMC2001]WCL50282.1 isochorismatase family protein [Leptospira sp. GIMC2001]